VEASPAEHEGQEHGHVDCAFGAVKWRVITSEFELLPQDGIIADCEVQGSGEDFLHDASAVPVGQAAVSWTHSKRVCSIVVGTRNH
jgi:hypothetical protein